MWRMEVKRRELSSNSENWFAVGLWTVVALLTIVAIILSLAANEVKPNVRVKTTISEGTMTGGWTVPWENITLISTAHAGRVQGLSNRIPSDSERLQNAAMYCGTDGAMEQYGSRDHCYKYFYFKIKGIEIDEARSNSGNEEREAVEPLPVQ